MHEDIMRFSSQWFYHNELESAPEVSGRGILRLDTPIVWFDTSECDFTENTREETMSRVNRQEAELLVEQLRSYIQKISKERVLEENIDFGLISPYKAQVQYIRKLIKQDAFFKPLRRLITVTYRRRFPRARTRCHLDQFGEDQRGWKDRLLERLTAHERSDHPCPYETDDLGRRFHPYPARIL